MPDFEICFEEVIVPFDRSRKFSYELAVRAWKKQDGTAGKRKLQVQSLWRQDDGEETIRRVSTFSDEVMDAILGNHAEIMAAIKSSDVDTKEVPF